MEGRVQKSYDPANNEQPYRNKRRPGKVGSAHLVVTHEAAVAFDIGAEDSGELALDAGWRGACRMGIATHLGDYPAIASSLSNGVEG